jgi:hypothetical protein
MEKELDRLAEVWEWAKMARATGTLPQEIADNVLEAVEAVLAARDRL